MTLVSGSVPVATVAVHVTVAVPEAPVNCSGIDSVVTFVAVPLVTSVTVRVWVLDPTVSVQLAWTRWAAAVLVTDTVGLASAR